MPRRNPHLLFVMIMVTSLWEPVGVLANSVGNIVEEAGSYLSMIEGTLGEKSPEPATNVQMRQITAYWPFHKTIKAASTDFRIPEFVIAAVVKCESDWNPKAQSTAGARGLMQVMPSTAAGEFGISSHRLWNPIVNVYVGTAYLRKLSDRYRGDWTTVLSAYNAGPGRVDSGRRLPLETIRYRKCVAYWADQYRNVSNRLEP